IHTQPMEDAVYWMGVTHRTHRRVTLNAAPINVADGLKRHLFEKHPSVVMTSATLCTAGSRTSGASLQLVHQRVADAGLRKRQGAYLPHWTKSGAIYAISFRLADALPAHVTEGWKATRTAMMENAQQRSRP